MIILTFELQKVSIQIFFSSGKKDIGIWEQKQILCPSQDHNYSVNVKVTFYVSASFNGQCMFKMAEFLKKHPLFT